MRKPKQIELVFLLALSAVGLGINSFPAAAWQPPERGEPRPGSAHLALDNGSHKPLMQSAGLTVTQKTRGHVLSDQIKVRRYGTGGRAPLNVRMAESFREQTWEDTTLRGKDVARFVGRLSPDSAAEMRIFLSNELQKTPRHPKFAMLENEIDLIQSGFEVEIDFSLDRNTGLVEFERLVFGVDGLELQGLWASMPKPLIMALLFLIM